MSDTSKPPSAVQLLRDLQHSEELKHQPRAADGLHPQLAMLREWQANRLTRTYADLRPVEKIRRIGVASPFLVLFYALFWKGCIVDGWRGWFYALQRMAAEVMICLELIQHRLAKSAGGDSAGKAT